MVGTRDYAHALCFGLEPKVAQEPTDEFSRFSGPDLQKYEAIGSVAQFSVKEILVAREKSRLLQPLQQDPDVLVICPELRNIPADHPAMKTPAP